ncbi:MAG: Ldh family oxidoreductase, partial [Planctomycetes bacterium]|nr:Ldh family oxidoreductase [Planctomycetota bacterium]
MTVRLTLPEVRRLAFDALTACGATDANAGPVADSIADAEAEGIRNVGLGYLGHYCEHLRVGKVDGKAMVTVRTPAPATVLVDAAHGFVHPAFEQARPALVTATRANGIAAMAIDRSYGAGVIGWYVDRLARDGLVSLGFANAPKSMAPWGGRKPFFGTNPFAFAVPREGRPPMVVDQSSSATAKVNVVNAAARGESIPLGWALDAEGNPTTDASAGLAGSMAPSGGAKGAAMALVVDLMAAAMTGASFSFEAAPMANNEGGPPNTGQFFIAMDPERFVGIERFADRVETEFAAMCAEDGVRLPGDRRHAHRL